MPIGEEAGQGQNNGFGLLSLRGHHLMVVILFLDPEGDWERRGAQALYNPRTATGEERLERLHALNEDLNRGGVQSQAFKLLQDKVFRRHDSDAHSET